MSVLSSSSLFFVSRILVYLVVTVITRKEGKMLLFPNFPLPILFSLCSFPHSRSCRDLWLMIPSLDSLSISFNELSSTISFLPSAQPAAHSLPFPLVVTQISLPLSLSLFSHLISYSSLHIVSHTLSIQSRLL